MYAFRLCSPLNPALLLSGAAALSLFAAPALAKGSASNETSEDSIDETGAASTEAGTRRTFTPEDFARFAPRSALDMAQQIPGFSIQSGGGARGLGQADTNVLINGRRVSGKSNGPREALQRIPAEEVVRLELVDGAALEIGGLSGQVLNVITRSTGGITGQFRFRPEFRSKGTPARLLDGSLSLAGGGEKTEWTLALENDSNRRGDQGVERVFDAAGALIDTREEQSNFNSDRLSLSGSYARIADNGNVLNATGEVHGFFFSERETSERSGLISPSRRSRLFTSEEDEFRFEVGMDYEFVLGAGRFKLIALHSYENSPTLSHSLTTFADGSAPSGSVFEQDANEYESIARTEYSAAGLGGNLVFAAEAVRNILDITAALQERDFAGALQPTPLPGASARVDEDRADLSVTYGRALAPTLQFQSSLGAEYSKISQTGALGLTRTFYRPKGFVSLDWKAGESLNISGRAERVVGQLDFFDFLSTVDLNQDRENVTNAQLVPQQSWVFEIEATVGLAALGSINLRTFYEDISDIVDQIPIAGGGQAPGNIAAAKFYGLSGDLTLLSEGIGWRGTRLDVRLELTDSSVLDPLLGTPRKLSNNTLSEVDVDLRHDFSGTAWAVGGSARVEELAKDVRIDEVSLRSEGGAFVSAFVENKDIAGLTMRASVGNLAGRANRFDRTVFIDRAAGIVDFTEDRDRSFGAIFTLAIEGSF
ncbi:TonB-dependent receptor plug domain-containing protein [Qipengyuania sp. ASV99]|uniref:TonB-dependent receptor plug domain-containing protein n=1 Tax=Qipengyuania sp. ASV99 TaxID=3399681 RepID=UPI003A4C5C74